MAFTKAQRNAAKIYQGIGPDEEVEADHIKPKSKGGADDVANLRFISPDANRMKSDNYPELRKWQIEFEEKWRNFTPQSFLCTVIPGGGKTIAALNVARSFIAARPNARILVITPTLNLRRQWAVEAQRLYGIKLQTKEFGTDFKRDFDGGVATYQTLDYQAEIFRVICSSNPTLVIMDEPHHCGDKSSWGEAARHSFENAERLLLLSGTPFRTDGRKIPFVQYDGSLECVSHHKYDYPSALQDGIVRHLVFDYERGKYEEKVAGENRVVDFHGGISYEQAEHDLRQLLNTDGEFVSGMIKQANQKLREIRTIIPDAAAMAVCIDTVHAKKVASIIRKVTGFDPSVVVHDEETATDDIDTFRRSNNPWLVSVRMVSEGIDIKRLQVLCYLTNAVTILNFRQLVGRISRRRPFPNEEANDKDEVAFVFLPADPRLIKFAETIEEAQRLAIEQEVNEVERRLKKPKSGPIDRQFIDSELVGTDCTVIGFRQYDKIASYEISTIASVGGINMERAKDVFEALAAAKNRPIPEPQPKIVTEEEVIDRLRRQCNKLAGSLARLRQCEVREIHMQWPRKHAEMTKADFENKATWLIKLIRDERQRS